jgi:hypothetical protein
MLVGEYTIQRRLLREVRPVPGVPLLVSGPQSLTLRTVHGADNDIVTW